MIGVNPLSTPSAYRHFFMAGAKSPGAIPLDGIDGFDLANDWEVKKGKGKDGATITKNGRPPLEGSIRIQLWRDGSNDDEPDDFADWDTFKAGLIVLDEGGAAIDIQHPLINDQGVVSVVIKLIGKPKQVGAGMWEVKIDLLQWVPTPKTSSGTPGGSAAGSSDASNGPGGGDEPATSETAQEKEFREAYEEAAK